MKYIETGNLETDMNVETEIGGVKIDIENLTNPPTESRGKKKKDSSSDSSSKKSSLEVRPR